MMKVLLIIFITIGIVMAEEYTDTLKGSSSYDDYYYDDDNYDLEDRESGYGGGDDTGINPLAALIAPLAGLALLG